MKYILNHTINTLIIIMMCFTKRNLEIYLGGKKLKQFVFFVDLKSMILVITRKVFIKILIVAKLHA